MAEPTSPPLPPDINKGPEILAVCGTLIGFSIIIVALRVWVRLRILRWFGWDDASILISMIVLTAEYGVIIAEVHYGAGRHVEYIEPPEHFGIGMHLNFATQPMCVTALTFAKVSVGLFLLRLTPDVTYRRIIIAATTAVGLSGLAVFCVDFLQCRPIAMNWDPTVVGTCIPPASLRFSAFFNSGINAFTDLFLALLPIPMIWSLQLAPRVKFAVNCALGLGICVSVASLMKIPYMMKYGEHGDFLYDSAEITNWITVETCAAIIAASIPTLKPLFRPFFGSTEAEPYNYKDSPRSGKGYIRNKFKEHSNNNFTDIEMLGTYIDPINISAGVPAHGGSQESILPHEGTGKSPSPRSRMFPSPLPVLATK